MIRSILRPAFAAAVVCLFTAFCVIPAGAMPQSGSPSSCVGGSALNGWYGVLIAGSTNNNAGEYFSGALDFNGACGLTGNNFNGGIGINVSDTSVTGSYGQNSDGTYDLTLNLANQSTPMTFIIGVSASGNKAVGIESDGTAVATIDVESQLTTLIGGYSTSSLTGTYSLSCSGSGVDLNYISFDGMGNLNGVDPYDNGGSQGNSPFSGTYSVSSDGTFSASLTGSYSQYTFTGVIDNGLTEIQYTYNQAGLGGVVACSGRQAPTATLAGYYGMVVGGRATNGLGGQEELSGSIYFNGAGALTVTNLQGGINTQYGNTTATGTYTANGDGTLTISMTLAGQTTPQTFIVGVSEGGNEAVGIETDGLGQATIDLQSQLVSNGNTYSTASLNGTYAAVCSGAEVDLNYVTFDGQGNQTGVDPYDNGTYGDNPYAGTYTVNSDGTFSGGFGGAYANYLMTGVIDNATSEIEYTYDYIGSGSVVSCVGTSTYSAVGGNPVAATPTFSPAPGSYNGNQTVTISDTTPNATIYYTTNGVTPTSSSLVYSIPITVAPNTTVEAIAVANDYNNSAISAGTYFYTATLPTAATPTFNPLPGNYNSTQVVTISDTTPGAVIHCTTDGSPAGPSSPVCSTVTVSATTTIEAVAVASGYNNSAVPLALYTITPTAATPTFDPLPGTYNSTQTVTLSDTTSGAVIHCTTDGTPPTANSPVCTTETVSATTTIAAIAVANGYNNSAPASGLYTITPTAATPTFNPLPGTYTSTQTVTLSDTTSGAVIHCTTDGTPPTANSPVCTTETVSATTTIAAIAVANGYNNSAPASGLYTITPTAATPSFNPLPGTYNSAQNVTISDTTPGAVIHCTTNGTTPTATSPVCTTVSVSATTTIEAIAVANGYNNSAPASGLYTITPTAAAPTFNPLPGTYNSQQTVTLSDITSGAVIHCTTDGTPPTATSPVCTTVSVSATTTIEAIAVANGYNNSAPASGLYTITPTSATPSFNPLPGTYNSTQNVTISDTTSGAVIHCTTNGTTPTATSPVCTTVLVSATTTIEAIAVANGYNNSAPASGLFTITQTAATPTFTPLPGTYNSTQNVTLSAATPGAVIHCTTNGTTPTATSPVCTTVTVSATTTIEAIAVANGYNNSAPAAGLFTITPTAATPTFNPLPGAYNSTQNVTLSDATPGAVIHCTTNGSAPTATSPVCTSLSVSATTTIEAIAVVNGYNSSATAMGTYTIKVSSPTVVNLASYYNVYAITSQGSSPIGGGVDGYSSYTYDSSTLGTSATYKGLTFPLGGSNALDAVNNRTIPFSAGQYSQLYLLATGVDGSQVNQSVVVTYTDGTTSTFAQSFSDWGSAQNYPGETVVTKASNRVGPHGFIYNETTNLYGYTFALIAGKTPATVKLPSARNVVILGLGLGNSSASGGNDLSGSYNVYGIATSGTSPISGGLDNDGNAYNSGLLGTSLTYQNQVFSLGGANALDASSNNNVNVPDGQYSQIYLVGAAVNGAQTNQTIIAYYSDGSSSRFTQNFSDWAQPQGFAGETLVAATANRIGSGGAINNTAVNVYGYTFTLTAGKTLSSATLPSNRNVVFLALGVAAVAAQPTPIVPYIQVNNGSWQETSSLNVNRGSSVNLGPQPLTGGSWSWTGPNGYTSTSRQINNIPLSFGSNVYVATYTNTLGAQSTQTFTITVSFQAVGTAKLPTLCREVAGDRACELNELVRGR
jgi:Chitobiase/beta-hexosaminidase C-terminal domain